jgi:hypothetical protein
MSERFKHITFGQHVERQRQYQEIRLAFEVVEERVGKLQDDFYKELAYLALEKAYLWSLMSGGLE